MCLLPTGAWKTVESVLKYNMLCAAKSTAVTCHAHVRHAPAARGAPAVRCLLRDGNGSHAPAVNSSGTQRHPQNPQLTPWSEEAPAARPPLLVMTQRGIPDVRQEVPDNPCPTCAGTGKVLCGNCRGKGRLNYRGVSMLPHGAWPQWCPSCRASGRWHCERCMGTGVKREQIGFRLTSDDSD